MILHIIKQKMQGTEHKLHRYQLSILRSLVTSSELRFSQLAIAGLESEHMNYHLQKLVASELVDKTKQGYKLSDRGKEYANLLDDGIRFVEKQPKSSVLLHVVRRGRAGRVEHLLSKRLRQPYLSKIGRLTGKVQFGEPLKQAAARELYEETGLKANFMKLEEIYHKLRFNHKGECVQDNIFYRFFIKDLYGEFIAKTEFQENLWLSEHDLEQIDEEYLFSDLTLSDRYQPKSLGFTESNGIVQQGF